jgi:hypothetical protein
VALLLTFLVVVFAREVSRVAHQEQAARQSENLSFATMAETLLGQENSFDAQLTSLLSTGSNVSRIVFAEQVSQMTQDLSSWRNEARLLTRPVLSPSLNLTLVAQTQQRASDYATVLSYVAHALQITGPASTSPSLTLGAAQLSLMATAATWGADRHELDRSPGGVTLSALTATSARLNIPQAVTVLASAPTLAATRAIVISAIQVQPAPFPAPAHTLLLAPTSSFEVQVAVSNLREITQPLSLEMTLTSSGGVVQRVTMSETLSPLASYAFAGHIFSVTPGERGTLTVTLNGVPSSPTLLHSRTYALSVSPSGLG